jgi:hypothetical protein
MSAAKKIPEELVSKITLMAYALSPHPLATMVRDAYTTKLKNTYAKLTEELAQLTDEVAQLNTLV